MKCKYCGTNEVVKCGSYRGIQRYLCKLCKRKFKDDDHVFHMRVPVEYINYVLNSYYTGMRINRIRNNLQLKYGYYPSSTLIRLWVDKFTKPAIKMVINHRPAVGSTWVVNEMILRLGRQNLWIYEVVDDKTNYLLAIAITLRSQVAINTLIQRASEVACSLPKLVLFYMPPSRFKTIEKGSGYVSQHVPKETYADRHRIGISGNTNIYDTNIYRITNPNYLRTLKTAHKYFNGLSIQYNYFDKSEKLISKTPAEAAQITYPYHSWEDLIEQAAGH